MPNQSAEIGAVPLIYTAAHALFEWQLCFVLFPFVVLLTLVFCVGFAACRQGEFARLAPGEVRPLLETCPGLERLLAAGAAETCDGSSGRSWTEVQEPLCGIIETHPDGIRLLQYADTNRDLPAPVFDISTSRTVDLIDRRHDAEQGLLGALFEFPWINFRGKTAFVAGFGAIGQACAAALKALGFRVMVAEIDPFLALKASLEGYEVRSFSTQPKNCQLG